VERLHPEDREQAVLDNRRSARDGGVYEGQYRLRRGDGSYVTILDRGLVLADKAGEPVHMVGVFRDVSERENAEQRRRDAERARSTLLDRMNEAQRVAAIGSWEWDLQADRVWWSDETYRIFGVTPQDYVPNFEANGRFIHPDDLELYGASFEHSLRTGEPLDLDCRLVTGGGELKYCNAKGEPVCDAAGRPIRFVGTLMDISERKDAQRRLEA
jgi:PAS domain S-box-containing protein